MNLKWIEKLNQIYNRPEENKMNKPKKKFISASLAESIAYFKASFNESDELMIRQVNIVGVSGAIISWGGMISKDLFANGVFNQICLANIEGSPLKKYEYLRDSIISSCEQNEVSTYEDAFNFIMSGFVVIAMDGCDRMLAIAAQGFSMRSISEPNSETMQRDSREGFVENLAINMTMIRRRMKTTNLKYERIKVGTVSNTDVCLCYLTNKVSPKILEEVKKKLNSVNLETVMASGYLIPYLEEKNDWSLFNSVGMSERPDTICGKLNEGRIAVIIDGTPTVLIVPYLFIEYFQNLDDYSMRPYFATFTRWLKYIAFFISILFPALYVGIGTFNPEVFPNELLSKIAMAVGKTPFSLTLETIIILFIYEVMREAGLRLPKPLGHAVSIVGGLVIGQAAVESGLIGSPTLMIVALTAISSYVVPNLYEAMAILRLLLVLVGGFTSIWGIMLVFCAVIVNICSKSNFGIPFTAPIAPFSLFSMRDVLVRVGWKTLSKKDNKVQNMPGANI